MTRTDPRKPVFDAVRAICPENPFNEPGNIDALHNLLNTFGAAMASNADTIARPAIDLTERIVLEILEHEAIVPEAYKDSVGEWTWGVGITRYSGHRVDRYKDNPQTIERCLEVYLWALRTNYLPKVLKAFEGFPLAEHELGAALSFHFNTGGIDRAEWVALVKAGKREQARTAFLNWRIPPEIISRRKAERDLFFDGRWTSDGLVTVYDVSRPSYSPRWSSAKLVDVRPVLRELLG